MPPEVVFLLRFTRLGHEAGYSTAELEDRALVIAEALGLPGVQVSVTPTLVEVSVGPLTHQSTHTLRVRPATLDLGRLARLDALVRAVLERAVHADDALVVLDTIGAQPISRPWPVILGAYALAGAALTPVIGGGWREAVAAGIVGALVGAVALLSGHAPRMTTIVAPLAAIVAGWSAVAIASLGLKASPDVVGLAALVTFLPGLTLTVGVRELATEHLQSGVANTANALVQLLGLIFGFEIGRSIATSWFGAVGDAAPHAAAALPQVLAAAAAGVAFTVSLKARSRDMPLICAATVLAIVSNKVGAALLGRQAGVFGAAFVVGAAGGVAGARLHRSPLVFLVPGVLMLVPGSAGFNSALQLLANHTESGVSAAFDTFVTAISIAYGLMIATVVLPRRFAETVPRPRGSQ